MKMEDRNWIDYYKEATREQIIADVVNDKDYIKKVEQQLQAYKEKEDKIIELITAPIDGMSLDWQSKCILQIINDKEKKNNE